MIPQTIATAISAAALVFVASCDSGKPDTPTAPGKAETGFLHVDGDEALDIHDVQEDLVVLDIRTPEEYAEAHIPKARNIDFKAGNFREEIAKLDKAGKYLVHCRSGRRSTDSLPIFKELAFTGVIHLDGGFNAWQEAGGVYEKGE